MDFDVSIGSFQRAIKVIGVVVRVNADDATGRVLIEADKSNVKFMANNGSTEITFSVDDCDVRKPGITSVAYGKIKSFVSSFKSWDGDSGVKLFRLKSAERTTKIFVDNIYSNGNLSKSELKLTNFNPALVIKPAEFEKSNFSLNSTIFRAATSKVLYAINPQVDFNQPALQGMNIKFDDDYIYFAGLDGVVLSEYKVKNVSNHVDDDITLQYNFIMGLRRLLSDDTPLLWEVKGNKVNVQFDEIVYSGRRIIGHKFPDYSQALDNYTDHINLSKEFLMSSLYPFSDVLDPEDNFRLTFEIKDKILKIFNAYARVETEQNIAGGLNFSIDLNGRNMIQTIEAIKDDQILFKFSNESGPAIFDSSTYNDQKSLILPIKKR